MSGKATLGLIFILVFGSVNNAWASTFVLDQSNPFSCANFPAAPQNPNMCGTQNPYSRGVVQTFTPSFSTLDFVTVWVHDAHDDVLNSGSLAELTIRAGGVGGAVLGVAQLSVANHGYSPSVFSLTFTFATPVNLVPGGKYAWQFTVPGGDTEGLAIFGTAFDPYAGGTGFSGGSDTGGDWFFGEGIVQTDPTGLPVPEPATLLLLGSGLGVSALRRFRRLRSE